MQAFSPMVLEVPYLSQAFLLLKCCSLPPSSSLSWKKKSHYKRQKDFRLLFIHENLISGTSNRRWTVALLEIGFGKHKGFFLLMRLLQLLLLLLIFFPYWHLRNLKTFSFTSSVSLFLHCYTESHEFLIITLIFSLRKLVGFFFLLITQGVWAVLKPELTLIYQ